MWILLLINIYSLFYSHISFVDDFIFPAKESVLTLTLFNMIIKIIKKSIQFIIINIEKNDNDVIRTRAGKSH